MKIGVIGHSGKVGTALKSLGAVPIECDITKLDTIEKGLEISKPEMVILAAAKSNVDYCQKEQNKLEVISVNLHGAYNTFLICERNNIPCIFISSDHVFDGKSGPYWETRELTVPVNFYGASKLAAESMAQEFDNVSIVRTSTLFDETVVDVYRKLNESEHQIVTVSSVIKRSFLYVGHFAQQLVEYSKIVERPKILNLSGKVTISHFDFIKSLCDIFSFHSVQTDKKDSYSDDCEGVAPRPILGGLNTSLSGYYRISQFSYIDGLEKIHNGK